MPYLITTGFPDVSRKSRELKSPMSLWLVLSCLLIQNHHLTDPGFGVNHILWHIANTTEHHLQSSRHRFRYCLAGSQMVSGIFWSNANLTARDDRIETPAFLRIFCGSLSLRTCVFSWAVPNSRESPGWNFETMHLWGSLCRFATPILGAYGGYVYSLQLNGFISKRATWRFYKL